MGLLVCASMARGQALCKGIVEQEQQKEVLRALLKGASFSCSFLSHVTISVDVEITRTYVPITLSSLEIVQGRREPATSYEAVGPIHLIMIPHQ